MWKSLQIWNTTSISDLYFLHLLYAIYIYFFNLIMGNIKNYFFSPLEWWYCKYLLTNLYKNRHIIHWKKKSKPSKICTTISTVEHSRNSSADSIYFFKSRILWRRVWLSFNNGSISWKQNVKAFDKLEHIHQVLFYIFNSL